MGEASFGSAWCCHDRRYNCLCPQCYPTCFSNRICFGQVDVVYYHHPPICPSNIPKIEWACRRSRWRFHRKIAQQKLFQFIDIVKHFYILSTVCIIFCSICLTYNFQYDINCIFVCLFCATVHVNDFADNMQILRNKRWVLVIFVALSYCSPISKGILGSSDGAFQTNKTDNYICLMNTAVYRMNTA